MNKLSYGKKVFSVFLFSTLAHLNVADRFTISGLLPQVQPFYNIDDSQAGLLSTTFILSYVLFSLISSFIGDRFNRKVILLIANTAWVLFMIGSAFIPSNAFWIFLLLRSISACGNAVSFGVAVPMIGDLFQDDSKTRSYCLMIFYWSLPIGSSLGILVSSVVANYIDWQWILLIWPVFAIINLLLIQIFVKEHRADETESKMSLSSIWSDMKEIFMVKSFIFAIIGQSINDLVIVSQVWWKSLLLEEALEFQTAQNISDVVFHGQSYDVMQIVLNVVVAAGGIAGSFIAITVAQAWKDGRLCFSCIQTPVALPWVAAIGTLLALPSMILMPLTMTVYFINFYDQMMPAGNNVISAEIVMEAIPPSRRVTATSILYVIAFLLGDCPGPYIVGAISDAIRGCADDSETRFYSLTTALYITSSLFLPCAIVFIIAALFLKQERLVEKEEEEEEDSQMNMITEYERKLRESLYLSSDSSFKSDSTTTWRL